MITPGKGRRLRAPADTVRSSSTAQAGEWARGGGRRFGAERRLVKKWGRESEHGTQQE